MDFPKVAAFGTGMAVFVRVVACRLPVGKPMCHDSFTTFFAVIIPFAAKKNRIRHLTMDFTITGSMWHRVVAVGIITGCLFSTFFLPLIAVVGCPHTLPSAKRNP